MSGEDLFRAENIHKSYGSVKALSGVDFRVGYEEIVGLIGDNGAGKSTLVNIIAGSLSKDKGKIYWRGEEVEIPSVRAARDLGIETVYQDQAVVDTLSVAENIFLSREPQFSAGPIKLLDREKMRKEAKEITERLDLDIPSPDHEVRFCSGGERQGVAIGRAMHFDAELVILDEPTTALSVSGVERVMDFIGQLRESGVSCIFITHNMHHAFSISDRFVVLKKGKKIADVEREETSVDDLKRIQMSKELEQ
ncbi:MAG: ATP-binding cassette domain-containing protein [Candidatus Hadarchaeota archaeon]